MLSQYRAGLFSRDVAFIGNHIRLLRACRMGTGLATAQRKALADSMAARVGAEVTRAAVEVTRAVVQDTRAAVQVTRAAVEDTRVAAEGTKLLEHMGTQG